jgi:Uma2 family endonuclease
MTTPTVELTVPQSEVVATPTTSIPALPPANDDPFRYGWRWVPNDEIDGRHKLRAIPLTLEDVLHPEEGDEIMHSEAHERRRIYLYNVLVARTAQRPDAVVLSDVRIAWDVPGLKAHGPDLMVIFGVTKRKNWTTFNVAEERVRPALIIEVVLPEYATLDRSTKLEHYDQAGVPLYVILDTFQQDDTETLRILAYHRPGGFYTALPADTNGRIWLEPVQIGLGIENNELVIYDEHQVVIPTFVGMAEARAQAEARAALEAEQRAQAEARAAALEAQLQALQAEIERLRKD